VVNGGGLGNIGSRETVGLMMVEKVELFVP